MNLLFTNTRLVGLDLCPVGATVMRTHLRLLCRFCTGTVQQQWIFDLEDNEPEINMEIKQFDFNLDKEF